MVPTGRFSQIRQRQLTAMLRPLRSKVKLNEKDIVLSDGIKRLHRLLQII